MDGLRWLLLLFGLLVVAGVYWFSRRNPGGGSPGTRREPSLGNDAVAAQEDFDADDIELDDDDGFVEDIVLAQPEKVVTLRLVAGNRGTIAGDELALGLRSTGMRHGKFGIFHRYAGDDDERIVFSAASLVEPGSFDLAHLKDQRLPGISLFMVLPGPMDGPESFDLMITTARALAQTLSGELLDESGSTLSIQRERYLREEIIQYQHRFKVA